MNMYSFPFYWLLFVILFSDGHSLHLHAQQEVENEIILQNSTNGRIFINMETDNQTIGQNAANWTDGDGIFINTTMRMLPHVEMVGNPGSCQSTRLLFFFHGPMGDYKKNWAKIKEQFGIEKLDKCGAVVRVLLSTSLTMRCYGDDTENACQKLYASQTNEKYLASIESTFAPHLKAIVTSEYPSLSIPLKDYPKTLFTDAVYKNFNIEGFIDKLFKYVVVMRTDVILTQNLDVKKTCDSSPGYNIISSEDNMTCGWHNRDTELAQLACESKFVDYYFEPNVGCREDWAGCNPNHKHVNAPPLPADFLGNWTNLCDPEEVECLDTECPRVLKFQIQKVRLGTLDKENIFARIV